MVNIDIASNVTHPSSKVKLTQRVTLASRMFLKLLLETGTSSKIELMLSVTVHDTDDRDDGCVY